MANNILATGVVNAKGFESEAPNNFAFATWRAVPFTTDGPAVFLDGSKVPAYNGQLDAGGSFAGALIGDTSQMRPPSTRFMFQIFPVASAPPITISDVTFSSSSSQTLGDLLSAQIFPLRIQAGPLVYAYSDDQIVNPVAGSGYVNTTSNTQWLFVGSGSVGMWIEVAGGGGGGGVPSGPNHAVQYNASGSFGGDSGAVYDGAGNLTISGAFQSQSLAALFGSTGLVQGKTTIHSDATSTVINVPGPSGALYLCYEQGAAGVFFGGGGHIITGSMDGHGNLTATGTLDITGAATLRNILNVLGKVNAANFLSGTSDTTYLMRLTSAAHNQALLETTAAAEFALLRFQTPSQAWTVGASGSTAPGALPGSFQIYDATGGGIVVEIDPATGFTNFHGDGVWETSDGYSLHVGASGHPFIEFLTPADEQMANIEATVGEGLSIAGSPGVSIATPLVITGTLPAPIKTYGDLSINNVTGSRAFATPYQNTSGMSLAVSMTGKSVTGGAVGNLTVNLGPVSPPANAVAFEEITATVANKESAMFFVVPPGWWYEVQVTGDIAGAPGRWWEWTCP
jgi:hypothetical protein